MPPRRAPNTVEKQIVSEAPRICTAKTWKPFANGSHSTDKVVKQLRIKKCVIKILNMQQKARKQNYENKNYFYGKRSRFWRGISKKGGGVSF